jgi:hypothetical protein
LDFSRLRIFGACALSTLMLLACAAEHPRDSIVRTGGQTVDVPARTQLANGAIIHLPVFGYVSTLKAGRTLELTATVTIHNTSDQYPIVLLDVQHVDDQGKLQAHLIDEALEISPLGTVRWVIPGRNASLGIAHSLRLEWGSRQASLSDPIVEAVMIGTQSGQGASFTTEGKIVQRY